MTSHPEVFTADYVGMPGQRVFYVQARGDFGSVTYLVEKQQVALLAEKLQELLLEIDPADTISAAPPARDPAMALEEPVEARWRAGAIGLGFDEIADRIVILLHEVTDDEDTDDEVDLSEGDSYSIRRDQARSFALHAIATLAEGRPTCRLCGLPMDPEGHACPASNGHHRP